MRAKFPIAFAAIVSSCIVTDVRVASSLSLRYGVGGEMEIAVESLTGVNTSKAAAKINLTRENISSYCEHRNVPSGHCASEVVEKIGKELRKEIVADCVGGSWVDMFGHSYSLGGGHIPSGSDQRRIIVVDDVTGEVLDGSRESGFLVQEGIVRMLCPELTDYVIQSMKPHREDNFDPKEKRLAYGSRAGQELTITSETGLDTSKASVKFVHTRKNAKEWCELYLQDNSKACVDKNLASPTPLSLVTGDCMKRTWKDMYGDTYVFLGRNKKATPLTSNDYIIKRVNTNETLDGSSASGYGVQISIFQTLCPKTFEREEQKYIRKSKDWDAVHGLNLSTDRKRTTRIKEEPEVLSDGKENLPHEMSVVTRFRDIREEPEVLGDGKENLPTARSIVDTQGDSILSLQAKSRVPLQNTHGQGDDEELAGKTEDTFSPSAPPKPRLKPIEVLMMAAVNMKLEPASAPPPDPDENLLRTPGKSPNYVIDAESMTETASLEPGAAAKTSLIEEIEGGNVPKDAAITSHFDIDQQLGRVRHPGEVKVYVMPRKTHFSTDRQRVHQELLDKKLVKGLQYYLDHDGSHYSPGEHPFLALLTEVLVTRRRSMNQLKKNFIDLKESNGWRVVPVAVDELEKEKGSIINKAGRAEQRRAWYRWVLDAEDISFKDFFRLQERKDRNEPLTDAEKANLERYWIKKFYRSDVTEDLVEFDEQGKTRERIALLEVLIDSTLQYRSYSQWETNKELLSTYDPKKFDAKRVAKAVFLREVFSAAGVFDLPSLTLKPDALYGTNKMKKFVDFIQSHNERLQRLFEKEVNEDVAEAPVKQLGTLLRLVGLRQVMVVKNRGGKAGFASYQIDPVHYQKLLNIMAARAQAMTSDQKQLEQT